MLNMIKCN